MSKVLFTESGWNDYTYWENEDKKTLKRIKMLILDISRNGNFGIGKPELLKDYYQGFWSRRIDDKNRLIYRIENDVIITIACKTHYNDK